MRGRRAELVGGPADGTIVPAAGLEVLVDDTPQPLDLAELLTVDRPRVIAVYQADPANQARYLFRGWKP